MSNNNSFFPLNNNIIYRRSKINKKGIEKNDEHIKKNIGPYSIINKINEGNNSKIYLAKSKYTNDEVAIKIISKEPLQENLEDLILVLKQIESLKLLKHKNIISLYEIYESPKYFYFIMEYLPKKNLIEKIILKKRLSENEALIIFIQLLDALIYMNQMNIAHRNLRTEHILFDKNNRPKIIGFNYSTFFEKDKKLDGQYGSLCYICPEILNEEQYNPELSDVWSLGVILYVMICGYLPFSEENDEKNKNNITEGKVEYPKEISNKIKDLLKHMLEVNANKRYNYQKILKHPWVKNFAENKNMFIGGINIFEIKYPVDERILNIIETNFKNFDKNEIKKDLIENKYNEGTGLYKLLLTKIINMKFNSVSDLFSDSFIKYIQNKNNYFNNTDKNKNISIYKKYIDKINNKINKLENYINDYKKREDDVAKYLVDLQNLKNSININNNIKNKNLGKEIQNNSQNSFSLKNEKNSINNEDSKYEDEDIIKKFKEQQDKQKLENENIIINNNDNSFSNSLLYRSNKSKNGNIISKINNVNILNNNGSIISQKEKENNENLLYSIKRLKTNFQINSRKSHIDRGSLLDGFLKKNHPENIRKTLLRYSLFSNISEEEDDDKNNNKNYDEKQEEENAKNNLKELKYSISFMDDGDEEESEFNESSYISRHNTIFLKEIKDTLNELNNMKKKEKEKKITENSGSESFKISPKRSNFKEQIIKKKKNVHFDKEKNTKFIKENVNDFIINNNEISSEKNSEGNNYVILSTDLSFNEEIDENLIKNIKKINILKIKPQNICNYKNDKFIISKLSNIINGEITMINDIDKRREKFFLFSFFQDKINLNKINIDNIKSNEDTIEKNFKIYINKINNNDVQNNFNNDKDESKKNNIMKYNESILNKSNNNLQGEQIINSSNNSIISNNKNSSIINSNNNNFLYDNNFLMNNELNEVDDSIYKIIDKNKDSNRDTSFDISSIQNLNKKCINEKAFPRIYDNELKNKPKIKKQSLTDYKNKHKNLKKIYNKKSYTSINNKKKLLDLNISEKNNLKNQSHNSFIYDKKRMRNRSLDHNPKNYLYISKALKNDRKKKIKFIEKSSNKSLRNTQQKTNKNLNLPNTNNQKIIKQLEKEFLNNYVPNNINYKTLNYFKPIETNTSKNLYKRKHIKYSCPKEIDNKYIYINTDINKKFKKKTFVKNISFDCDKNYNKKKIQKTFKPENEKDINFEKKNKKYVVIKVKKSNNLNNPINTENSKSLYLLRKFPINKNKNNLKKSRQLLNQNKSLIIKNNENINIIHEKITRNKKSNKNLENMFLKRKEVVKKIRNCKKYLNNLKSDKNFYTVNQTKENLLTSLSENPSKEHKILLSDINLLNDKTNNVFNDSINKSNNLDSTKNLVNSDKISFDVNLDSNSNIKSKLNSFNNSKINNNIYELYGKNYYNNINNTSVNSSSYSHENNDKITNIKKKFVSNDTTNNKITYYTNSSIKPGSIDNSLNFEEVSLILGKPKRQNFASNKAKNQII